LANAGARAAPLVSPERDLGQTFADIATRPPCSRPLSEDPEVVNQRLRAALQGRGMIERAKRVRAQTDHLGMDDAFDHLVQISDKTE
jgi:hypothetical protein